MENIEKANDEKSNTEIRFNRDCKMFKRLADEKNGDPKKGAANKIGLFPELEKLLVKYCLTLESICLGLTHMATLDEWRFILLKEITSNILSLQLRKATRSKQDGTSAVINSSPFK